MKGILSKKICRTVSSRNCDPVLVDIGVARFHAMLEKWHTNLPDYDRCLISVRELNKELPHNSLAIIYRLLERRENREAKAVFAAKLYAITGQTYVGSDRPFRFIDVLKLSELMSVIEAAKSLSILLPDYIDLQTGEAASSEVRAGWRPEAQRQFVDFLQYCNTWAAATGDCDEVKITRTTEHVQYGSRYMNKQEQPAKRSREFIVVKDVTPQPQPPAFQAEVMASARADYQITMPDFFTDDDTGRGRERIAMMNAAVEYVVQNAALDRYISMWFDEHTATLIIREETAPAPMAWPLDRQAQTALRPEAVMKLVEQLRNMVLSREAAKYAILETVKASCETHPESTGDAL